jgi:signal peptidase II
MEPQGRTTPLRLTLIAAFAVLAIDIATKLAAVHWLQQRPPVALLGGAVHLQLLRNPGGPTGILDDHPEVVTAGTLVAVLAMLGVTLRGRVRTPLGALALGLVLGAGTGNLLDRLLRGPGPFRGGVVDWLRPPWGDGVMNFADLMINAGIVLGVVAIVLARGSARAPAAPATEPAPPT